MDDKNKLLDEYDAGQRIEHNLEFRFLVLVCIWLFFVAFLLISSKNLYQK